MPKPQGQGQTRTRKKKTTLIVANSSVPFSGCAAVTLANCSQGYHLPVSETQKGSALAQGNSSITTECPTGGNVPGIHVNLMRRNIHGHQGSCHCGTKVGSLAMARAGALNASLSSFDQPLTYTASNVLKMQCS